MAGSVLEFYRTMLAFRRATPALRAGRTQFFDLPEPILAFARGGGEGRVLCLYNLSPGEVEVTLTGTGEALGPSQAARPGPGRMTLGPNGFAFLSAGAAASVAVPVRRARG